MYIYIYILCIYIYTYIIIGCIIIYYIFFLTHINLTVADFYCICLEPRSLIFSHCLRIYPFLLEQSS